MAERRNTARDAIASAIVTFLAAGEVRALPPAGAALPDVTVERADGRARKVPDRAATAAAPLPMLIIYEDRDAGEQNRHVRGLLERAARAINKARIEVVAIGDVSAYDFWPARRFVLADIRERQARDGGTIWLDWNGSVRMRWRLTAGRSAILVLDAEGLLRFGAEGPLGAQKAAELRALLEKLGCDLR